MRKPLKLWALAAGYLDSFILLETKVRNIDLAFSKVLKALTLPCCLILLSPGYENEPCFD